MVVWIDLVMDLLAWCLVADRADGVSSENSSANALPASGETFSSGASCPLAAHGVLTVASILGVWYSEERTRATAVTTRGSGSLNAVNHTNVFRSSMVRISARL